MTSITPPTRPPAKRDALRVAVRQLRFQRVVPARLVFLLAMLALLLGSVSVAHAQTTAPTVSTVAVTSNPGTDETYALGDTIEVGLTFSEAVTVTGAPYILIDVGGTNRRADYHSGTGATQLKFQYTVLAGDDDDDGIAVVANSLTLNGGSIVATDDSTAATLDNAALTTTTHKMDIVVTLLSNFGQTESTVGIEVSAGQQFAPFAIIQTGNNPGGYTLTDIVLDVMTPSATLEVQVRVQGSWRLAAPSIEGHEQYVLTGSVATAGNQTFSLNSDEVGTLLPNETYLVYIGSSGGSGTVMFAKTDNRAVDIKVDEGWDLPFSYLGQVGTTPRIQLNGYQGATPVLFRAWFSSQPNEGDSYAAGENIEVVLVFSGTVDLADTSYGLPLRLGSTGDYVKASPVYDSGYRWLFSYTVQPEDVSSDNVRIANPFLFLADDVTPGFVSQLDSSVPIRTTLSFAVVEAEADHSVDGTQSRDCEHLYCGYLTVGGDPDGQDIGFNIHGDSNKDMLGMLTQQTLRYDANRYAIYRIELGTYTFPLGWVRIMWLPDLPDAVLARLSFEAEGTEFRFSEADEKVDFYVSLDEVNVQFYRWYNSGLDWEPGERVLVKIIEIAEVSFAADSHSAGESGDVDITVSLSNTLGRNVTIPLTTTNQGGAGEDDYSGVPENLTFVSGETEKSFTISLTDDDVDDDDESVLLAFGDLRAGLHEGDTASSIVTIVDNDDPEVEVSFGQSAYDVAEGAGQTVTVNLDADPERTVVIPLTATNQDGATDADYSVPASVTFDTGETTKDITFAATDDSVDDDGESVVLGFGALPDRVSASTTTPSATVTILDDDARGVTVSPTSLPVDEGMTAEYTVVLKSEPTGDVTVTVNDPTDNTDVTAAPASSTFDENDWDTPKTVTVSALQDADGVNETATVTHTVSGADYAPETASDVRVTVDDDETPDVTIAPTGITVLPGGSNEYTVVLDTEPTVQVTVTVTGHADTVLSVSPEQLTFDANDWNTPKTVEVSADDSVTTTETITLVHGLAGGEYRSVTADDVAVTVVKASGLLDFQIGVTASPQALTVPEDRSRTYSAFLSAAPTGDVTVTINLPTGNDLSIDKNSLTFTTDNWNVPQAVRVSAADDDDGIPDAPVTIGHTVSGGGYGSGDNFGITVTIEENDTRAVTLSTVSLVIAEGEEATYTVALDTQPSDDVTVVINDPTDNTDVTAAPASLTFTRSNWSAPQTVTVTTVADHDTDTDTATVTHTVSGGDYAAVTAKNVDVTVTDGCIVIWCGVLIMEKDPRFTRELRTVSLEDDDFDYKNTYYRLHRPKLYGGGPDPREDYSLTVRIPERAWFKLDVRGPLYETEHYLDWTLYVNGIELPFGQAKRVWDDIPGNWRILFKWYGREFHELFPPGDLGTGATLYLSIKETPLADQTPTVTGPPLHLNVETWNRDELWATWTRPQMRNDDDRNLYVDSYRVQWKEGSGDWETPADVTEATLTPMSARFFYTHVIEGLTPGVEYEVRVIATNAVGDSEPSNVATGMIEPDSSGQQSTELRSNSPATGGPGISGTPLIGETLTATTSGIQDEDGLTDADFAYQWVRSELGSNSETDIAGATGSSYAVTSDDAGKAIKVRVTFADDAGNEESLTSFGVIATPALPDAQVPDPPGTPDVSPYDSTSLAVSWTEPASGGGSAITGYKVQWKEAADSWDTSEDVSEAAATGTSHTITGLTSGTEYSVRVLAINDAGESLPSEDGSGTPRETVPPELSAASVDGATLILTFNEALDEDSEPPTTAFKVTVSGNVRAVDSVNVTGGAVTLTLPSAVSSADTVTVSYTAPASESAERLRDSAGNAAASFTDESVTNETAAQAAQAPGAPGRPDVAREASGSLSVSWDAPSSDGGSSITGYKVQWKQAADRWDTPADVSEAVVTGTGHTIAGLIDGVEYSVRVIAANEAGDSPPSTEQTGTPNETVPPVLSEASADGAALTLTFNEDLDGNSAPPTTAFTVTVNGNERGVESVDVSGSAVTLTLAPAVATEDAVAVSYAAPSGELVERLRDTAGNAAASFTGRTVANETAPPAAFTASVHDVPDSHDGQTAFTFELRFSEAPKKGFSYKTLRDHAFTVTGGSVTRAVRMEKGNNIRWTIHVEPDSDADLTVVLLITVDCDAQGAICTGDGRMLSNSLNLTVAGPGG